MDTVKDLFFNINNTSPVDLLLQTLVLIGASLLVIWLARVFWFRSLRSSHPSEPVDVLYHIAVLRSYITFMVVFAIYFFFLIKLNGLHAFRWSDGSFYLGLLPVILMFILPLVLYFVRYSRLIKLLK